MMPVEAITGEGTAPAARDVPRPRHPFLPEARLRTAARFRRTREGNSAARRLLVVRAIPAPDGCFRAGIVISRRYDRLAVQRNRARRLLREGLRLLYPRLRPGWFLFLPRQPLHTARMPAVRDELASALRQLGFLDAGSAPPAGGPPCDG